MHDIRECSRQHDGLAVSETLSQVRLIVVIHKWVIRGKN